MNLAKIYLTLKDSENNTYRSNMINDKVGGALANISLNSSTTSSNANRNIVKGDEVNYKIIVKNIGTKKVEKLSIEDKFSEFLELEDVKLNNQNYEYFIQTGTEEDDVMYNKIVMEKDLDVGEEAVIDIKGKAKENNSEETVEVLNQAEVFNEVKLAETTKDETKKILQMKKVKIIQMKMKTKAKIIHRKVMMKTMKKIHHTAVMKKTKKIYQMKMKKVKKINLQIQIKSQE